MKMGDIVRCSDETVEVGLSGISSGIVSITIVEDIDNWWRSGLDGFADARDAGEEPPCVEGADEVEYVEHRFSSDSVGGFGRDVRVSFARGDGPETDDLR
jgi:hypothetical protein